MDRMQRLLNKHIDQQMAQILDGGTATNPCTATEPLTIDRLKQAMALPHTIPSHDRCCGCWRPLP
jgi:hypothetical protein